MEPERAADLPMTPIIVYIQEAAPNPASPSSSFSPKHAE